MLMMLTIPGEDLSLQQVHHNFSTCNASLSEEEELELDLNDLCFGTQDGPNLTEEVVNNDDDGDLMASISLLDDSNNSCSQGLFAFGDFDGADELLEVEETLYEHDRKQFIWYENFSLLKKISKKLETVTEESGEEG